MLGPDLLARYLTLPGPPDRYGQRWQYHSRSDRHSKVGSWGVAVDLLATSALMRAHAAAGKIVIGVNHEMRDFATGRKKDLDLVIARPSGASVPYGRMFADLASDYAMPLSNMERNVLRDLPAIPIAPAGAVLVALEAKACMTAHVKSLPRLYDELNSSHLCVHGASSQALAIAYVQVNNSASFVSPVINGPRRAAGMPDEVTQHRQPADTLRVLAKVAEIPRRSSFSESGFDALGITVMDLANDGNPVTVVSTAPAPQAGDDFEYSSMVTRMANEYDTRFGNI